MVVNGNQGSEMFINAVCIYIYISIHSCNILSRMIVNSAEKCLVFCSEIDGRDQVQRMPNGPMVPSCISEESIQDRNNAFCWDSTRVFQS